MQDLSLAAISNHCGCLIIHIRKASDKCWCLCYGIDDCRKMLFWSTLSFFSNFFLWFRIFVSCVPSQECRAAKLVPAVNFQCVILFWRYLMRVLLRRAPRYSRVSHFALCRLTLSSVSGMAEDFFYVSFFICSSREIYRRWLLDYKAIFCLRNDNFHPFIPIDWPLRCDQSSFRLSLDEVNCFWI